MNANIIPDKDLGCGPSRTLTLSTSYENIVNQVGLPNVTDQDDESKVKASWAFKDKDNRIAWIWCYKYYGAVEACTYWSADGDKELLNDLFPNCVK